MKIKKILAVLCAALMLATVCVAVFGCGEEDPVPPADKFLEDIDISTLTVSDGEGAAVFAGEASFVPMKATSGDFTLNYRVYIPDHDEGAKLPVLLFLHGAGERGTDNLLQVNTYTGFADMLASGSSLLDAIVIAPQCGPTNMWVNFDDAENKKSGTYSIERTPISESLTTVLKVLKYYDSEGIVDRDRIYSMGMSMGGYGTWDLLCRYTDVFAAGVPICGGVDLTYAEALKDVPIRTFHGTLDPVIPVVGTRAMVEAIKAAGGMKIEYTEYPEGYHDVWNQAMSTEGLADWLLGQKLSDRA